MSYVLHESEGAGTKMQYRLNVCLDRPQLPSITVGLPGYAIYDFCRLLWWIFVDFLGFLLTCSYFVNHVVLFTIFCC